MTREEAIGWLKAHHSIDLHTQDDEAHRMAIKALEQEPCEDAISRQAVINAINHNCVFENEYNLTASRIKNAVESLPPVYPKAKVGKFEVVDNMWWVCDQCFCKTRMMKKYNIPNYCPACGCKMEGVEE